MPNPVLPQKRWYSTTAAARLLGVSVGTVQHLVEDGRLHAWKTSGGHRRIDGHSLAGLLDGRAGPALAQWPEPAPPRRLVLYCPNDNCRQRDMAWLAQRATLWHVQAYAEWDALLLQLSRQPTDVLLIDLSGSASQPLSLLEQLANLPDVRPRHSLLALDPAVALPLDDVVARSYVRCQPLTEDLLMGYLSALQMQWT